MFDLVTLPRLRRWASNWARLIILLASPKILLPKDRSVFRRSLIFQPRPSLRSTANRQCRFSCLDFDSTLGYPGEGASSSYSLPCHPLRHPSWIFLVPILWIFTQLDFGLPLGLSIGVGCCCLLPSRCCVV